MPLGLLKRWTGESATGAATVEKSSTTDAVPPGPVAVQTQRVGQPTHAALAKP